MTPLNLRDLAFVGGLTPPATGPASLLLLNGGSSPIIDTSSYGWAVTANGTPEPSIVTTPPFQDGWIYFPNTLGSYLTIPSNPLFAFGAGDFTVETLVYLDAFNSFSTILEIGMHLNPTGIVFMVGSNGAQTYSGAFRGSGTVPLNTINHVAWVREAGVLNTYVNYTRTSSVPFSNVLSDVGPITIGSTNPIGLLNSNYRLNGYIRVFKVTPTALYSGASFTP